ncbi:VOC family protein [Streptomyces oceani]|uniref:VOC domain-containing protein n=1 Tax=Streptomyces oceani TaxID=1075402 RepID=A0A1E7KN24_9ACTN|nr:VOC family protein [Streptomyces oceani]OEV05379.1 hypothetical protein AN216_03545 [Streptomyces oceani]
MHAPQSPKIGAIVLGSTNPERLWEWYRTAFAPEAKPEDGVLALELAGNTYLIFERRDDVAPGTAEPGRLLVNFDVTDIHATERWLNQELSVRWVRPVTDMDGEAYLATLEDPDGNYVQIVQPTG